MMRNRDKKEFSHQQKILQISYLKCKSKKFIFIPFITNVLDYLFIPSVFILCVTNVINIIHIIGVLSLMTKNVKNH